MLVNDEGYYGREGAVAEMKINAPSNKGLGLALLISISPLVFFGVYILADLTEWDTSFPQWVLLTYFVLAVATVLFWAAGIVRSVVEIARYNSKTAEVGLFLLVLAPIIWVISCTVFAYFQFALAIESFSSFIT